jgi:hypothetical protein
MESPTAYTPRLPDSRRWQIFEHFVAWGLAAVIGYFVVFDYVSNGFGVNNMRMVSFVDSLWHCYCFRVRRVHYFKADAETGKPQSPQSPQQQLTSQAAASPTAPISPLTEPRSRSRSNSTFVYTSARKDLLSSCGIFVRALAIKYFASTVVSIAFGQMPVIFKGVRHMESFLLALTVVQGLPSFTSFIAGGRLHRAAYGASSFLVKTIQRSTVLRSAIRISGALYKMRKLSFITESCIQAHFWWSALVALAVLTVEGSAVAMTADAMVAGGHPWWRAVWTSFVRSRWRVAAAASLCLAAEFVVCGAEWGEVLPPGAPTAWEWVSPFKVAAFALLVVRGFGGFTAVTGYPLLSAVATQCTALQTGSAPESPANLGSGDGSGGRAKKALASSVPPAVAAAAGGAAAAAAATTTVAAVAARCGSPQPLTRFQPVQLRRRGGSGGGDDDSGSDVTAGDDGSVVAAGDDHDHDHDHDDHDDDRNHDDHDDDDGGGGIGGNGGNGGKGGNGSNSGDDDNDGVGIVSSGAHSWVFTETYEEEKGQTLLRNRSAGRPPGPTSAATGVRDDGGGGNAGNIGLAGGGGGGGGSGGGNDDDDDDAVGARRSSGGRNTPKLGKLKRS